MAHDSSDRNARHRYTPYIPLGFSAKHPRCKLLLREDLTAFAHVFILVIEEFERGYLPSIPGGVTHLPPCSLIHSSFFPFWSRGNQTPFGIDLDWVRFPASSFFSPHYYRVKVHEIDTKAVPLKFELPKEPSRAARVARDVRLVDRSEKCGHQYSSKPAHRDWVMFEQGNEICRSVYL